MFAFLLTLLILDALVLSVVVLLQAGQGGGLASLGGGGTDTVLGGRQAVTILTKLSWWCGGIFLVLSLMLSLVSRNGNSSALQERLRAATPAAPQQAPLPLGTPTQPSADAPKAATPGAPGSPQGALAEDGCAQGPCAQGQRLPPAGHTGSSAEKVKRAGHWAPGDRSPRFRIAGGRQLVRRHQTALRSIRRSARWCSPPT